MRTRLATARCARRHSFEEKGRSMLRRQLALAPLLAFLALRAFAEEASKPTDAAKPPDAPKPPYTLSANVFLVSDYFFRGLTQTWRKPAIQGGADFVHDKGIYLGTWASNV